jgi:hypothetical protein
VWQVAHIFGEARRKRAVVRVGDVVDAVAVDAGRHVGAAVDEGVAVDARPVLLLDRAVAAGAGRGDEDPALREQLPVVAGDLRLGVGVVAVGADRRLLVPRLDRVQVDAVVLLVELLLVAGLARRVAADHVVPHRRRGELGVGYSPWSGWQSAQPTPIWPWTDASHAAASIVMSFEEPSGKETVEPASPWQSRHSCAGAGAPARRRADPRRRAAAVASRRAGLIGPPGDGRTKSGGYFIVAR